MKLTKTEDPNLWKDENSKALLSTDVQSLQYHKLQRKKAQELKTQENDLNNIKSEVAELKDELVEIKDLLYKLLKK
jgi:hypothetical protein